MLPWGVFTCPRLQAGGTQSTEYAETPLVLRQTLRVDKTSSTSRPPCDAQPHDVPERLSACCCMTSCLPEAGYSMHTRMLSRITLTRLTVLCHHSCGKSCSLVTGACLSCETCYTLLASGRKPEGIFWCGVIRCKMPLVCGTHSKSQTQDQ